MSNVIGGPFQFIGMIRVSVWAWAWTTEASNRLVPSTSARNIHVGINAADPGA